MEGQIKSERKKQRESVKVFAKAIQSRNDESLKQMEDIVTKAIKGLVVVMLSLMLFAA